MSVNITNAFVENYERLFRKEYEAGTEADTDLINHVSVASNIGNKLYVTIRGPSTGRKMTNAFGPAQGTDPDYRRVEIQTDVYTSGEFIEWYQDNKLVAQEAMYATQGIAHFFKRTRNQIIIDELDKATTYNVPTNFDGSNTNLTFEKMNKAVELLRTANVPMSDCCFVIHSSQVRSLMEQLKLTSSDYVNARPIETGALGSILGTKIMQFGDFEGQDPTGSGNNGLPKTGNIRTAFLFHKDSVGFGKLRGEKLKMRERNDLEGDVVEAKGWMDLGGTIIKDKGIVKIFCDESK